MSAVERVSDASHHERCRRENTPGDAHALTFPCFQRRPFLSRDRTRRWLVDALAAARDKHGFDLWAFVIMPEHAHVLIHPVEDIYSVSTILASIKLPVSRRAGHFVRVIAPRLVEQMTDRRSDGRGSIRFWQRGGGYDRNLRSPRYVWETIKYLRLIRKNPHHWRCQKSPQKPPWRSNLCCRFFAMIYTRQPRTPRTVRLAHRLAVVQRPRLRG